MGNKQGMHDNELRIYLETIKGEEHVRCRLRGDPALMAQMIAHACEADGTLFAAFVSGVSGAMEKRGISSLDLKKLARGAGINL